MQVELHSTTQIVEVNGVPARVWEGRTDSGIEVTALITRIATPVDNDLTQFNQELQVCDPPTMVDAWPSRLIL